MPKCEVVASGLQRNTRLTQVKARVDCAEMPTGVYRSAHCSFYQPILKVLVYGRRRGFYEPGPAVSSVGIPQPGY